MFRECSRRKRAVSEQLKLGAFQDVGLLQVVDARDPLMYRSKDLEAYCQEIHASKGSVLLLNKADLLSLSMRTAWADYFDSKGISYLFWSAKAAAEQDTDRCKSLLTSHTHSILDLSQ